MKKYIVTVNGNQYEVTVEEVTDNATTEQPTQPRTVSTPKTTVKKDKQGSIKITVPMAGTISEMLVKPGDKVTRGQTVCTLEAMKMINNIPAPQDGVVVSVEAFAGARVETDQVVVTID